MSIQNLYKVLFIIALSLGSSCVKAQDITISSTDLVNLKNELQQQKDSVNFLKNIIKEKENLIHSKDSVSNLLSTKLECSQTIIVSLRTDSIGKASQIATLQQKEKSYSSELHDLQKNADENAAKLANGRLYFKYSDKLVQPSIQSLQGLKTEEVKKNFEQALRLLQSYKIYSDDLKSVFVQLQSINKDLWKSKHQADEYKNTCSSILKQSVYFKDVYIKKGQNNTWSIPYLDNLIDAAKSIISKHNPVESEFANFSLLIEML